MTIKVKTLAVSILILLLLLNERIFYLLDSSTSLGWIIIYCLILFLWVIYLPQIIKGRRYFGISISILIGIALINFFNSYYIFDQSLLLSLSTYRYIPLFFLYYPLLHLFIYIGVTKIKIIVVTVSTISSLIYIVQKALYPNIIFLNVFFAERFGEVRFFNGTVIIIFGIFTTLSLMFKKQNKFKKTLALSLVPQFFFIIFVAQSRSTTAALIAALAVMFIYLILKTKSIKSIKYILLLIIPVFAIFPYISLIYESAVVDINRSSGSAYIRTMAQEYFLDLIFEKPLLGYALFSDLHPLGSMIKGTHYKFYAEDIGLIGLTYQFGFVYSIIYVYILLKVFLGALPKQITFENKLLFMGFTIFVLSISLFTTLINVDNSLMVFIIYICLFETVIHQSKGEMKLE